MKPSTHMVPGNSSNGSSSTNDHPSAHRYRAIVDTMHEGRKTDLAPTRAIDKQFQNRSNARVRARERALRRGEEWIESQRIQSKRLEHRAPTLLDAQDTVKLAAAAAREGLDKATHKRHQRRVDAAQKLAKYDEELASVMASRVGNSMLMRSALQQELRQHQARSELGRSNLRREVRNGRVVMVRTRAAGEDDAATVAERRLEQINAPLTGNMTPEQTAAFERDMRRRRSHTGNRFARLHVRETPGERLRREQVARARARQAARRQHQAAHTAAATAAAAVAAAAAEAAAESVPDAPPTNLLVNLPSASDGSDDTFMLLARAGRRHGYS